MNTNININEKIASPIEEMAKKTRTINVIDYNDFPRLWGVKLAVVEVSKKNACKGCVFYDGYGKCSRNASAAKAEEMQCVAAWRYDGKDVIYRGATDEEIEKFN